MDTLGTFNAHTDPEQGIGQTECPEKTASGSRSTATIEKRQWKNWNLSFGPFWENHFFLYTLSFLK